MKQLDTATNKDVSLPAGIDGAAHDRQAMEALNHLSDAEKVKVLDYLADLMNLSTNNNGPKHKVLAESVGIH